MKVEIVDRGHLTTEKVNLRSTNLDELSTNQLVNLFITEDLKPQKAVSLAEPQITNAVESIYKRLISGGKLYYLGAGTSGRLGVLDASECPPTFCTPPELVQGVIAGGYSSLYKSSEELEDNIYNSKNDLIDRGFSSTDCLVGITSGGTTPYVQSGLKYAKEIGALSIAIACVTKSEAPLPCDIDIRIITGPELITGSTRLKAGTATKMVLNIISSSVMIKMGKVYQNYMVDLSSTNSKLLDRSIRILQQILDISRQESLDLITSSEGSVKKSIVMYTLGVDLESASKLLLENNNNLRTVFRFHDN